LEEDNYLAQHLAEELTTGIRMQLMPIRDEQIKPSKKQESEIGKHV